MITVFIIDDHPLVADGVTTMLKAESNITVIGVAKTGHDAMTFLNHSVPDIILLDINLPDIDGLELCKKITALSTESKILMLTSNSDYSFISKALSNGAHGYLLKDMERKELLNAINTVLSDSLFVSHAANIKLLEHYKTTQFEQTVSVVLTRREKEILDLLEKGLNGPQIAEHLFISTYTVETHRKNLMQKLNANTTQMLLKIARDNHFLNN